MSDYLIQAFREEVKRYRPRLTFQTQQEVDSFIALKLQEGYERTERDKKIYLKKVMLKGSITTHYQEITVYWSVIDSVFVAIARLFSHGVDELYTYDMYDRKIFLGNDIDGEIARQHVI